MEVKKVNEQQPKCPPWFDYFIENQFKPLAKKVDNIEVNLSKTQKLLYDVIRLNNLKTHE